MAQVNPNDVATASVQALQDAITKLAVLKQQSNADAGQIDAQIDSLQVAQAALRDQALRAIEESEATKQAIAAMNSAAANLKIEAAAMQATAADLTSVAEIVTAATSLAAALAHFV